MEEILRKMIFEKIKYQYTHWNDFYAIFLIRKDFLAKNFLEITNKNLYIKSTYIGVFVVFQIRKVFLAKRYLNSNINLYNWIYLCYTRIFLISN